MTMNKRVLLPLVILTATLLAAFLLPAQFAILPFYFGLPVMIWFFWAVWNTREMN